MSFQGSVRVFAASGLPGEVSNDGPIWSHNWTVRSAATPNGQNPIGYAYTKLADGIATPGGDAVDPGQTFLGILGRPKEYALQGNAAGTLAPTYYLNDEATGTLFTTCEMWIDLQTAGDVGDGLSYEIATGAIGSAVTWVPDFVTYKLIPTAIIIVQDISAPGTAKIRIKY